MSTSRSRVHRRCRVPGERRACAPSLRCSRSSSSSRRCSPRWRPSRPSRRTRRTHRPRQTPRHRRTRPRRPIRRLRIRRQRRRRPRPTRLRPPATPDPTPSAPPDPTPDPTPSATPIRRPSPTPTPSSRPRRPVSGQYMVTFASGTTAVDRTAAVAARRRVDHRFDRRPAHARGQRRRCAVAALRADPRVPAVEPTAAVPPRARPTTRRTADQWSLPKIGWDKVFGSVPRTARRSSRSSTRASTHRTPTSPARSSPAPRSSTATAWDDRPERPRHLDGGHRRRRRPTTGSASQASATRRVSVMPVTVLGAEGLGQDSDIIEGIVWAADHGADVVLMSFSNPGIRLPFRRRSTTRGQRTWWSSLRPATTARRP